jgi:hypothetical protein
VINHGTLWLHPNQFDILDDYYHKQGYALGIREAMHPKRVEIIRPIPTDDTAWARIWRWICH